MVTISDDKAESTAELADDKLVTIGAGEVTGREAIEIETSGDWDGSGEAIGGAIEGCDGCGGGVGVGGAIWAGIGCGSGLGMGVGMSAGETVGSVDGWTSGVAKIGLGVVGGGAGSKVCSEGCDSVVC